MKTTIIILLASCVISFATILEPRDPYRLIGDSVWTVSGIDTKNGWVEFSGRVLEVQPGGIRIKGFYTGSGYVDEEGVEFFVANYPYTVAENERVGPGDKTFMCAKLAGTYTYPTAIGGSHTIRKLDYGTVYTPPPPTPLTPEQIAAAKAKAAAAKKAGEEKALKSNQAAAEKGDAYGLLRMGERYRDGDGVAKDLPKAREYFTKAVAAGSPSAQEELDQLPK